MASLITAANILRTAPIPPAPDPEHVTEVFESSHLNHAYEPFDPATLRPFAAGTKDRFRSYIAEMSRHVDFTGEVVVQPASSALPSCRGYSMLNEADVRTVVNTLYLEPVRSVWMEMLPEPDVRNYDWVVLNEARPPVPLRKGVPWQPAPQLVLAKRYMGSSEVEIPGKSTGTAAITSQLPVLLIQLKGPDVVYAARRSIQTHSTTSPDWIHITKQLRKYAVLWRCRRIVLMDQRTAFFFYLQAPDPADPNYDVLCVSAEAPDPRLEQKPTENAFTIRELLAFAAWHALEDEPADGRRKQFSHQAIAVRKPSYQPLGFTPPVLPPGVGVRSSQRQHIATSLFRPGETGVTMRRCTFLSMTADDYLLDDGTSMKPQLAHVQLAECPRCVHFNAGYNTDTTDFGLQCRCRMHGDTFHQAGASRQNIFSELDELTLELQEWLKPKLVVAAVESFVGKDGSKPLVVAKRFLKKAYLLKELEAYAALAHLQGCSVPVCIGVFEKCSQSSDRRPTLEEQGALYLLLEHVANLPMISSAQSGRDISCLEAEAMAELAKIHAAGVAHGAISMTNVLVDPCEIRGVVFVDFEMSEVDGERKWADRDMARFKIIWDLLRR
ncbi:hypothetical protein FN846DRAFT_886209 [Sphaerosporella brunnea]|uniref:Protein kinase domain-containing protein n=1 Tax=Sphaerosporella brunnea TaxID=1250544 RepID=A0A5J5FAG5_9PEZI|nr:hypothetical protein FN846DRAFT_886209 [Sphaerosporella brunnea]